MELLYKLVGFQGRNRMKEVRESGKKSCMIWKFKTKIVLKQSKNLHEMWNGFVDWLVI